MPAYLTVRNLARVLLIGVLQLTALAIDLLVFPAGTSLPGLYAVPILVAGYWFRRWGIGLAGVVAVALYFVAVFVEGISLVVVPFGILVILVITHLALLFSQQRRQIARRAEQAEQAHGEAQATAEQLREANQQLVGASLRQQELAEEAEQARRQAEELAARLADERRFFASILENVPVGIAYVDRDLIYRHCNAAHAAYLRRTVDQVVGHSLREVVPGDPASWQAAESVLHTGRPVYPPMMTIKWPDRPEQGERHYLSTMLPDKDASRQVHGVFILAQDVTELVNLRRQAETDRERLEAVLQEMPAGVIIAEAPTGQLILSNEQVERIWRHPFLAAAHIGEYGQYRGFHPDGRPYRPDEWPLTRSVTTGAVVEGEEIDFLRGDGTRGTMRASSAPVCDREGHIVAGVVTFYDVTEQKQIERGLRFLADASAALSRTLDYEVALQSVARLAVPTLADWSFVDVVDERGTIGTVAAVHREPAKEELLHELRRRYPHDPNAPYGVPKVIRTGEPEVAAGLDDAWYAAHARDAGHLEILRTLGLTSYMVLPLRARGRVLGTISLVTARVGQDYGPADQAIAEEVARRAALALDNARLYQQAQEAIRLRDTFLSAVSHDLKNPLGAIKGYAQLLKRRAARMDVAGAERIADGLATIEGTATKMAAMLNDLVDVARLQMGQHLALDRGPTNLVALAQQAAAEHQRTTERHRIVVDAVVPELVGLWDAPRLERVLGNLLSNAVKYSPDGGTITVRVRQEDDTAVLQVQDQGIGIPKSDLPHVFEWFYRARNVAGRMTGTGIGLAGACQIVEQHGGTIAVESEPGVGSTFTVRLPLS